MIEIIFKKFEDFLKVKEILICMGIVNNKDKVLY